MAKTPASGIAGGPRLVHPSAVGYGWLTLRLWLGVMVTAQIAVAGVNEDVAFHRVYLLVPFPCWVPNLLVAEYALRGSARGDQGVVAAPRLR